MGTGDLIREIIQYASTIDLLEVIGLATGLLAVFWLIRQNILTWPTGILYVLVSLVIFWRERLYADLLLHVVYLFLNIYGWYYWSYGRKRKDEQLPVGTTRAAVLWPLVLLSLAGIVLMGYLMKEHTDAALPYWDSATTVLSFSGMWLTARKKIENWYFWFVVDLLATGVYFYKEIYFYALLYMIYIALAVGGYVSWKKDLTDNG
jgi:nicotinamide mononucleotide transporter